ncbi:MAG: gamma-glutamylcyclotransferase family protein [Candidatus Caldarchaeales archaeon]
MVWYFAYGSNMDPDQMKIRGVSFSKRLHAVLKGFRLEFNKLSFRNPREGYANIVPDREGVVEGILYEVEDEDLSKLDRYEGYPFHYNRVKVDVMLDDGQMVEAVAYIARPEMTRKNLKPTKEYLSHLLKGSDLLSKEYYERLSNVRTLD